MLHDTLYIYIYIYIYIYTHTHTHTKVGRKVHMMTSNLLFESKHNNTDGRSAWVTRGTMLKNKISFSYIPRDYLG